MCQSNSSKNLSKVSFCKVPGSFRVSGCRGTAMSRLVRRFGAGRRRCSQEAYGVEGDRITREREIW